MILTKQLQVVIDSSLAQGRDYEDIRAILIKQGFQDADISELFSQYRGAANSVVQPKITTDTDLGLKKNQTSTPPVAPVQTPKEQLFNKNFVHPEVKPGFVPVGFEKQEAPQAEVKGDVQTFLNVGTNTQTAAHMMGEQNKNLPSPGTTLLPNELSNESASVTQASESMQESTTIETVLQTIIPKRDPSQKYINVGLSGMPEIQKVVAEEQAKKIEKSPWPLVFALLILIALMGGFFYWFFILNKDSGEVLESEKLLQEIQSQNAKPVEPATPPTPTGPIDPFTGLPLEN